ncbi:MAG: hypothetical protein M1822_010096 [Bathelium mastoideum]|nr:MAG: hypothetical protein M1822_010096 [Bathelium mastoideum]
MIPRLTRWISYILTTAAFLYIFLYYNPLVATDSTSSFRLPKAKHSSVQWDTIPLKYPAQTVLSLPTDAPQRMPPVQYSFGVETAEHASKQEERRKAVKKVFEKCWASYKKRAWMKDELAPVSGGYKNTFGGWAATLVDSLDTLWIMGMKGEFYDAVEAVGQIDFTTSVMDEINVFETTIRYLGGFLAAYDLSGDQVLRQKAIEVGEMVYVAFDTPNRMPITRWQLHNAAKGHRQEAPEHVLVAEIGSLTMEFTRLSQITGDSKWYDATQRIMKVFAKQQRKTRLPGMWPVTVNARDADFTQDTWFTLSAMADSLYEYLPKMHALLGGVDNMYQRLYEDSMKTALESVIFRPMIPGDDDILIAGNARVSSPTRERHEAQSQHLGCYAGGMFALGGRLFSRADHLRVANQLTDGCLFAYRSFPLGIMPEIAEMLPCPRVYPARMDDHCAWNETAWRVAVLEHEGREPTPANMKVFDPRLPPGFVSVADRRYILRPEAIESVFILYRTSGRLDLLDSAWDMFQAINNATATDLANAALADVTVRETRPRRLDSMESFWTAETLKYFYLVFSETDLVSLDEWVFNTEAHPFRRPGNG